MTSVVSFKVATNNTAAQQKLLQRGNAPRILISDSNKHTFSTLTNRLATLPTKTSPSQALTPLTRYHIQPDAGDRAPQRGKGSSCFYCWRALFEAEYKLCYCFLHAKNNPTSKSNAMHKLSYFEIQKCDSEIWLTQMLHGTKISIPTFTINLSPKVGQLTPIHGNIWLMICPVPKPYEPPGHPGLA